MLSFYVATDAKRRISRCKIISTEFSRAVIVNSILSDEIILPINLKPLAAKNWYVWLIYYFSIYFSESSFLVAIIFAVIL